MDSVLPLLLGLPLPETPEAPPPPEIGAAFEGVRVDFEALERVAARIRAEEGLPVEVNGPVIAALEQMIGDPVALEGTREILARAEPLLPRLRAPLEAAGLPGSLASIPFVESGFRDLGEDELARGAARRHEARPAGIWMFLPATARTHGLRVDALIDERRDVERQSEAAASLLGHLYRVYGDWTLALSAYNQGSERLDHAIDRGGTRDAWALLSRGLINDYPARVYAAALLLAEPALLGPPPPALR